MKITNVQIYDEKEFNPCLVINWTDDESFFGEVVIAKQEDGIKIYSETMSKDFVKELLCKIVDEAELLE